MKKVLVLNISTDSKDTSLGFAISWVNALSINYDNVDVITLNKGDISTLNENVNVYEIKNTRFLHQNLKNKKLKNLNFYR